VCFADLYPKLFVNEAAKQVVLECQTILGAYDYVKGFDMERYVRDVLLMPIIGGSTAIQKNNIAKYLGVCVETDTAGRP
jgi:alkylation response protein AidB-like acyl-CoA dehydrogenase